MGASSLQVKMPEAKTEYWSRLAAGVCVQQMQKEGRGDDLQREHGTTRGLNFGKGLALRVELGAAHRKQGDQRNSKTIWTEGNGPKSGVPRSREADATSGFERTRLVDHLKY